ncbi:MAG: LysE family translocator [Kordiimonas sp.]
MGVIDPFLFGLFIVATAVLVLTPGPIVSLAISETLSNGTKNGLAVVFAAASIAVVYLVLNYTGFSAIQKVSDDLLNLVRYAGAGYLVYLAYTAFKRSPSTVEVEKKRAKTAWRTYRGALFIAASNPKAILFFAAFFPQFISKELPIDQQLIVLSIAFICVTLILDSFWVFVAAKARVFLSAKQNTGLIDRISGSVLGLGAVGLLFLNS